MSEVAPRPNTYMVQKTTLNIESSGTEFVLSDMMDVESALGEYSESIYSQAVKFNEEKDQLQTLRGRNRGGDLHVWRSRRFMDPAHFPRASRRG